MYNIKCKLNLNTEPWNISLEKRCAIVNSALLKRKKIALLLYDSPDTSTFRYRAYNVFKATEKSNSWQSVFFFSYEYEKVLELLPNIDLIVIIRVMWKHNTEQIIYRAKALDIKVLFDVDDLIYDINYLNIVTNTLNVNFGSERDYEFWFACISRIGFTASKADGFITTNDYLGKKLEEKYNKPYEIIVNSVNDEQIEASKKCLMTKRTQKSKGLFTVGYFSGTPSHINDFRTVYLEIIELLKEYPDIHLNVVGFMDFPSEMQSYIDNKRISFTPLVDFIELQRLIAQVDVNIVPLVNNIFTNCKSELKFFESAIVDTITLAAPTYTYKNCIKDGVNGFLCNPGQWYERIKSIYNRDIDVSMMVQAANEYAVKNYYGERFLKMIEDCYDSFLLE